MLALLVVVVINSTPYFFSSNISVAKELTVHQPLIHSVHVIKNIEGEKLFHDNCSACHSMHSNDNYLSITRVENTIKDSALLYQWIQNSSKVLRSGNPYFNGLVKEYGVRMTDFPNLSDTQISTIIDYMREVDKYH